MNQIMRKLLNTSKPGDLENIITIDAENEVQPEEVGMTAARAGEIWQSVIRLYLTGTQPAITFCMRKNGKILFNRSIGHKSGNGPKDSIHTPKLLASPDMPVCLFSASKAIMAVLTHILAEDGAIQLDDRVSQYFPEFGKNGKQNTTIRHILSHRGGIPRLPANTPVETFWDQEEVWRLLCNATPIKNSSENLSYHALTGGFVISRIFEKVTGQGIQRYLDDKIRKPMGMEYFTYGIAPEIRSNLAVNYATGPKPFFPIDIILKRALGADLDTVERVINSHEWYDSVMAAGNLIGTAEEVSRFYQMMLNNGEWQGKRICRAETIQGAVREYGETQFDRTLMIPMRYSSGLMLGNSPVGLWGKNSRYAFGHIGLLNKLCWADESKDISVSLLTSGIPIIAHHIPALFSFVGTVTK